MNDLISSIIYTSAKGNPITNSLKMAKLFGKWHKNVLRAIKDIIANHAEVKDWFFETRYTDARGKEQPMMLMTRDGAILLAMGFTGEIAASIKMQLIQTFNSMERTIKDDADLVDWMQNNPDTAIEMLRAHKRETNDIAIPTNDIQVGDFARDLAKHGITYKGKPIGRNGLFEVLRMNCYCFKSDGYNIPTPKANELGIFRIHMDQVEQLNGTLKPVTYVTPRGYEYLLNAFFNNELITD